MFNMARWEGVEPPTAWFVAMYSIQLSYQRVEAANYGEPRRFRQLFMVFFRINFAKNLPSTRIHAFPHAFRSI